MALSKLNYFFTGKLSMVDFYDFWYWNVMKEQDLIDYFLVYKDNIDLYAIKTIDRGFICTNFYISAAAIPDNMRAIYEFKEFTILHMALLIGYYKLALEILTYGDAAKLLNFKLNGITPYYLLCSLRKNTKDILSYILTNNIQIDFNLDGNDNISFKCILDSNIPYDTECDEIIDKHCIKSKQLIFSKYYEDNKYEILKYIIIYCRYELYILELIKKIFIKEQGGEHANNSRILENSDLSIKYNFLLTKFKDLEIMTFCSFIRMPKVVKYILSMEYVTGLGVVHYLNYDYMLELSCESLLINFLSTGYSEEICIEIFQKSTDKTKILGKDINNILQYSLYRKYYQLTKILLEFDIDLFQVDCKEFTVLDLNGIKQKYIPYESLLNCKILLHNFELFKFIVDSDLIKYDNINLVTKNIFECILTLDTLKSAKYFLSRYMQDINTEKLREYIDGIRELAYNSEVDKLIEFRDFYTDINTKIVPTCTLNPDYIIDSK